MYVKPEYATLSISRLEDTARINYIQNFVKKYGSVGFVNNFPHVDFVKILSVTLYNQMPKICK